MPGCPAQPRRRPAECPRPRDARTELAAWNDPVLLAGGSARSLLEWACGPRNFMKTRCLRVGHASACQPAGGRPWRFYILLVTFLGISPGGARESSPWREPWEQTRTARSPGGAKEPFHGDSPIAGHERPSYAPTGLAHLWAGPTGLTPWAIF